MKNKKFITAGIILIIAASISFLFFKKQNGEESMTAEVKLGTIQKTVDETGTVFSKKKNTFYSD